MIHTNYISLLPSTTKITNFENEKKVLPLEEKKNDKKKIKTVKKVM
jgi:hypothetical protein